MVETKVTRRLAAILAADMVGYSRLMEADEAGTIARQRTHRTEVFDPMIAEHNGRLVKTTGDGLLVEFSSAVDAVQCAVDLQLAVAERERATPDDRRIQYRVGINLGDIVIDGDDILGDGVNVAARLEGLAPPGGVCVADHVYRQIEGKVGVGFEDMGERHLKNIAKPLRAYRVLFGSVSAQTPPEAFASEKSAIAVLPFDNLSGDPEQEYFSDGLSEDIITLLSAWRTFPVIARNSSFAFKGRSVDIRQIGKELSARYVIEGSVRKAGNRVRITAQLIDAVTGHHLWAEKFDRALDDIFEIQDEITWRIVSLVEPQMEEAERQKVDTKRSDNLSAWDYYLRGRALLYKVTVEENREAIRLLEKAIELDPTYSNAYAGLSAAFQRIILLELPEDRSEIEAKALAAARRAVALDEDSAYAHLALGGAYIWHNLHDLAIAETRIAAELNPSNMLARLALGNRLDIVGNASEGIPLLEKALNLSPRDPHAHIYFGQLARAYINARDYDKALGCLQDSVRRKPDHPHTYHLLAVCLGHLGRLEEARNAAKRCEELHPGFLKKRAHWNIYLDPAANEHLTEGLRKAGVID